MPNVRVWGYKSIVQIEQSGLKFHNADSVFLREEPYLWASGPILLNGLTPVSIPVQSNDQAKFIVIEVDDGASVRFELNPNGPLASNARNASTNSPRLSGEQVLNWYAGASLSFIDAAGT